MRRNRFILGVIAGLLVLVGLSACSPVGALPASPPVAGTAKAKAVHVAAPTKWAPEESTSSYGTSQAAQRAFWAWWSYEVQSKKDTKVGTDVVYQAGLSVCLSRHSGVETPIVLSVLRDHFGLTESGAQGVYKAAVESFCPQFNQGFQSEFDKKADAFRAAAATRVDYRPAQPNAFAYGSFLKETCAAVKASKVGGSKLVAHLRTQPGLELMQNNTVTDGVLRVYIGQAVTAGCHGSFDKLPPNIQRA